MSEQQLLNQLGATSLLVKFPQQDQPLAQPVVWTSNVLMITWLKLRVQQMNLLLEQTNTNVIRQSHMENYKFTKHQQLPQVWMLKLESGFWGFSTAKGSTFDAPTGYMDMYPF
jgi:hypothetical protein